MFLFTCENRMTLSSVLKLVKHYLCFWKRPIIDNIFFWISLLSQQDKPHWQKHFHFMFFLSHLIFSREVYLSSNQQTALFSSTFWQVDHTFGPGLKGPRSRTVHFFGGDFRPFHWKLTRPVPLQWIQGLSNPSGHQRDCRCFHWGLEVQWQWIRSFQSPLRSSSEPVGGVLLGLTADTGSVDQCHGSWRRWGAEATGSNEPRCHAPTGTTAQGQTRVRSKKYTGSCIHV